MSYPVLNRRVAALASSGIQCRGIRIPPNSTMAPARSPAFSSATGPARICSNAFWYSSASQAVAIDQVA